MKLVSGNFPLRAESTRILLVAFIIGIVFASLGNRQAPAQTWNLANDFSTTNTTSINMGISNAWSVGYDSRGDLDNAQDRVYWTSTNNQFSSPNRYAFEFTPFTIKDVDADGWIDHVPARPPPYNPAWVFANNGVPGIAKVIYTNDLDTPIGAVFLHAYPGSTGGRQPVVVRWVAPSDASNVTVTLQAWVAADYPSAENRIHVGILQYNYSTNFFRSAAESSFEFTDKNNTGDGVTLTDSTNYYNFAYGGFKVTNITVNAGDSLWYLIARRDDIGVAGFIGINMIVEVPQAVEEIPEPSSLLLVSLGSFAYLLVKRRKSG